MPTDDALRQAEELWPGARRHLRESPHDFREALASALAAAREQGVEEERERWRERVEAKAEEHLDQRDRLAGTERARQHERCASALRSLLSPAEVAGREEE